MMPAENLPTQWQILLRSLLIFLIWRCSLYLLTFFGLHLTEEFDFEKYGYAEGVINAGKEWQAFPNHYFFDSFFRFDSTWFDSIIRGGYSIQDYQSNVAFFPLYPYLSRWFGYVIGNHFLAGWLISNLSLIGSIFYIYRIGLLYFKAKTVKRALVLLLIFPTSFFLSAFYSEALFLFTSAASFYYFLTQRYSWAGILGMLASLTRFSGILLFFAFISDIAYYCWKGKQKLHLEMIFLTLIPAGVVIFMLILYVQVGNPLAFINAQSSWGREKTYPLLTLIKTLNEINFQFPREPNNTFLLFDWLSAVGFLAISSIMAFKKYRLSLWIYAAFSILLPLSTGTLLSMMRFCAVVFPVFFFIAEMARKPLVYQYLIFTFTFLLSIYNLRFMNWFLMI
ncbi:MAG: hypothetical protein AAF215_10440 [Cyanobacteria bacterium P01_A01_bin.123]